MPKVLVLSGSPRTEGNTDALTDSFVRGAKKAGASVRQFDAGKARIHPCIGCDVCRHGKRACIYDDDMTLLYPLLLEADIVAYVTPLYYHGVSAQLKCAIDRFHGVDDLIHQEKVAALISVGGTDDKTLFKGIECWFETDLKYLGWKNAGSLFVTGCYDKGSVVETPYLAKAFDLGYAVCANLDADTTE